MVQNGLIIFSPPKNLKKSEGKIRFYVALYHGEKFSVLQDPKVSSAAGGGGAGLVFNQGEMLSFLAYKDGELVKINKLNFKKKIKKLLSDNKQCLDKMKDKKWLNTVISTKLPTIITERCRGFPKILALFRVGIFNLLPCDPRQENPVEGW